MAVERTLVLIKPDALERGLAGEILSRFERRGLELREAKLVHVDENLAAEHYAEHVDKPFYAELIEFITSSPTLVLVLEGETLVGCKQNRVVTRTVLMAAHTTVILEVGCMEQGRWHFTSAQFRSGASPSEWKVRREIKSSVISSRSAGRPPALDQGALWARMEEELDAAKVRSSTRDYSALIEERRRKADELLAEVRPVDGQVGVLALSSGELIGLEVVGSHEMWSRLADRALRSLLPAATDPQSLPHRQGSHPRTLDGWLQTLAAGHIARRPALGLGGDFELSAEGAIGSGVWLGDRPAHFSVFGQPMADGSDAA